MKEFSVVMALVDFLPVILFGWGAVLLQRTLYDRMTKCQFALFAAGSVDVMMAGTCKALYKLLYGAGVCDFQTFNSLFFPVQSLGFLMAGLGVGLMVLKKKDLFSLNSVAPAVFTGTFLFVGMMCAGLGCMDIGLCVQAKKDGKKKAIPFFIVSFVLSLCMGYLSSKNFDKAIFNWISEGVNTVGQAAFLVASMIFSKKY